MVLAIATTGLHISLAQAQVANVVALQRITEKKSGAAGVWRQIRNGDPLVVNDRFRTGKRSKADIKFTDGSLLRLGQLSSVEIRDTRHVTLLGGQLLFSNLNGGRVLAGTAAAEIKGSVGIVTLNRDGSAEFSLFSGAMDVQAPQQTVALPPGHWVTARPDGSLSEIRVAPPLQFAFGALQPELTEPPVQSPFVGSEANMRVRSEPERLALDQYTPRIDRNNAIPFQLASHLTPRPTSEQPHLAQSELTEPVAAQITVPKLKHRLQMANNLASITSRTTDKPGTNVGQLAARAGADAHLEEIDRGLGQHIGGDVALLTAISDGGTLATGARLHGFYTRGQFYLDLAALPLRSRQSGGVTNELSSVPSASLTYRDQRGDVQIGRQRFLEGPIQAARFGSILRPGAREVMDAIRFRPNLGRRRKAEVAYIYDAFVRNLPFRQSGSQKGFYGRVATEQTYGNFGLNLLKYQNLPGPDTTGASLDYALSLVRNQVEFYGELGRDPFKRRLTTFGLAFPGLHDRTNIDLFVEYARMSSKGLAVAAPEEFAVRAYRPVGRNIYVLANFSRLRKTDTIFTLGIAVGARSYQGVTR